MKKGLIQSQKLWVCCIVFLCGGILSVAAQSKYVKQQLRSIDSLLIGEKNNKALTLINTSLQKRLSKADLAVLYSEATRVYIQMDSLKLAQEAANKSASSAASTTNDYAKAVAKLAQARVAIIIGTLEEVIRISQEGLTLLGDKPGGAFMKSYFYYFLYGVYSHWDDSEKMEYYARASLKFARGSSNENVMANAFNGLSSTFLIRQKKTGNPAYLDSSFAYLRKSLKLYKSHPSKVSLSTFMITNTNIANYFLEFSPLSFSQRRDSIFQYLNIAEKLTKKSNPTSPLLANIYGITGLVLEKSQDLPGAEKNYLKAIQILNLNHSKNNDTYYTTYKSLASLSEEKGEWKEALSYQQKAETSLMNMFNEDQRQNVEKLDIQYQTAKKDKTLQLLQAEAKAHHKQSLLYLIIGATLLIAIIFMLRSYHFKLRYSIEREKKLEQEKQDASLQAKLKAQEAERHKREKEETKKRSEIQLNLEKEEQARLKAEQELLRLRQEQLQKEVMATTLQVEHKNQVLQVLKSELETGGIPRLNQVIRQEMATDRDFETASRQIEGISPDYFQLLTKISRGCLTDLDQKYCAYLYLKMSTKQIAQMMNVEPQSVRMTKYRIKQKLNLSKTESLDGFLQGIVSKP